MVDTFSSSDGTPKIEEDMQSEIVAGAGSSQLNFVEGLRTDRLNILWKVTLVGSLVLIWLLFIFATATDSEFTLLDFMIPSVLIVIFSFLTRYFLKHNQYDIATWMYGVGLVFATGTMMIPDNHDSRLLVPTLGVLIVFTMGMLMSVGDTAIIILFLYGSLIGIPFVVTGDLPISTSSVFGFILIAVSGVLVTQVSGELYSIAEWALDSYRKERRTATQLHESRQVVEKSLLKQKNLTGQLQKTNDELDEARKSAELAKQFRGQFLANMSHELRTPLNAVIGFSETMLNFPMMYGNVELPPEYREDMERIYNSGKHLLGIINDILDLSRIDVGRLEVEIQPVELEPIFKGLLSTTVGLIGSKSIELLRDVPDPAPMVIGDPLRVRQVLLNLYSNAAKFTDSGHIKLIVKPEETRVKITVEDTGHGIAPDNLERVFEAFQQGESGRKQKRAGSGLGLAITKQLLDLMNGEIWVESQVDQGSKFTVTLPRYIDNPNADWEDVADSELTLKEQ